MILDLFRKEVEFENIQGYEDIKDIVKRAIDAEDNYNLLFIGPPASAKIICIDELDKMPRQFQDKLLNFMESGHIKVDQMRKKYDFQIKGAKVFATCNVILQHPFVY